MLLGIWLLCGGALEPTEHHAAMPHQVLLAVISTCLVWGWTGGAACFALGLGGHCFVSGEVVMAFRRDLILPADGELLSQSSFYYA